MPSASRILPRLAVAACAGSLLIGAAAGCSTTQEKAAKHQAESKRILDARAARQAKKKKDKNKGGKDQKPQKNGGSKQ
ncbi:MAG TPA: hypothetical protein VHR18_04395 [Solirubrobacterales bacterium]|nr:hypothetical protein [Solirubrobacterales bacterium]